MHSLLPWLGRFAARRILAFIFLAAISIPLSGCQKKHFIVQEVKAISGNAAAQYNTANAYFEGKGVAKNTAKGIEWLKKSADQEYLPAIFALGMRYFSGDGVNVDFKQAMKLLQEVVDQSNNPDAQYVLGIGYLQGQGVSKNMAKGIDLLMNAAHQGNSAALVAIGCAYYNGTGLSASQEDAVQYFRKAAEAGNSDGQYNLGFAYLNGISSKVKGYAAVDDGREALKWFQKAADQGNNAAQKAIGAAYYYGIGVPVDQEKGVEWYRKAAVQGNHDAQYALGSAYYFGGGVPKDPVEGLAWFYLSNDAGAYQGMCNLAEEELGPDSTNKAKLRAKEIREKLMSPATKEH